MKKVFLGIFIIVAILTTGCLGDAPKQIIGTWRYILVDPNQDDMLWTFNDDNTVYYYDVTTTTADSGKYEMYSSGTHTIVKITGTTIQDKYIPMDGEWTIIRITNTELSIGIKKDPGGFLQRDLLKQ